MTEHKLYLYPFWIRFWHMINALMCLALIITGLSMQFSGPRVALVQFDLAVSIHNLAGIVLTANYLLFFAGNLFTFNGKYYQMEYKGLWNRLMKQFHHYTFGVFRKEKAPFPVTEENKFNPLQQFSYVFVMYLFVPIVFITGWGMLFPVSIPTTILGGSGLHIIDFLHILAGFVISVFMIIHIYFCTMGKTPSSNFKSIVNGYHEAHD